MADTVISSLSDAQMVNNPLYLQATGGDAAIDFSASNFRMLADALWEAEGVLSSGGLKVTQRGAGANFSVDVAAGKAVILGDTVGGQGKYVVSSLGVVNVATPGAPGSGTRVHRIIARIRDKEAAGTNYDWTLELLEDTGSGTPALPASAISLATVSITVAQGSVVNANITDLRTGAVPVLSGYKSFGPDAGFPVALTLSTSAEGVAWRATVPASPVARNLVCMGSVWMSYTQSAEVDSLWYAGGTVVGRHRVLATATEAEVLVPVGFHLLPAATPVVMELRVVRNTGTGTVNTSISSGLTTAAVIATAV